MRVAAKVLASHLTFFKVCGHGAVIMLGMLIEVLRFDGIAVECRSTCEFNIMLVIPLVVSRSIRFGAGPSRNFS